jgi:hypothetical protein
VADVEDVEDVDADEVAGVAPELVAPELVAVVEPELAVESAVEPALEPEPLTPVDSAVLELTALDPVGVDEGLVEVALADDPVEVEPSVELEPTPVEGDPPQAATRGPRSAVSPRPDMKALRAPGRAPG